MKQRQLRTQNTCRKKLTDGRTHQVFEYRNELGQQEKIVCSPVLPQHEIVNVQIGLHNYVVCLAQITSQSSNHKAQLLCLRQS
jgi:hypothetical protein